MKITLRDFFLSLLMLINFSCGSRNAQQKDVLPAVFENGKIIPVVSCRNDPTIKYALYLPTNYSAEQKFPVILAFDPNGAGNLPLKLYQGLAEQFGYILVGSNDSKNGNPVSETTRIISSLFTEINERFSIDTNRIYSLGFSGGARIASLIGLFRGGVTGVIGCGAGFPGTDQPAKFQFDYIGFAGTSDFNMNEMVRLENQLEQINFNHALILFDGIHKWPSDTLMKNAFIWNECCAMRKQLIPRNDGLLTVQKAMFDSLLNSNIRENDKIASHRDLKNAIRFMKDLADIFQYDRMLLELESDPEYIRQSAAHQRLLEREIKEQQILQEEFFFKDLTWWKSRISGYNKKIAGNISRSETRLYLRMKGFLSLLAYMNYNRMLKSNDPEKADFALQIYRMVDPENASKIN